MQSSRSDRTELSAPSGANAAALGVIFAISTAFLFAAYCMARALVGGFGTNATTVILAFTATTAASIFLWWLAPFADFAEIFWVHLPADRRSRRSQCPHCAYPHGGRETCSECGQPTAPLRAWTLTARPARRLLSILIPALLIGCLAGELWSRLDESRFVAESNTAPAPAAPYTRPRAFPASFARMWIDEYGVYHSEAWPEFARDRSWKR
jgi:hypothetical protein